MDPSVFESSHVHKVYNQIAQDFSRTRHSRWPFVESFLTSLPRGSLVLDAGTGNGKYLGVDSLLNWEGKQPQEQDLKSKLKMNDSGQEKQQQQEPQEAVNRLFNVGYDMSEGLLSIASSKGHEVVRGDCVDMSCWRRGSFDHAISIATIHHFATPERRTESIKQMILSILPPSPPPTTSSTPPSTSRQTTTTTTTNLRRQAGQILIVVWSLEQDPSLLGARSARRTTGGKKGAIEIELDDHLLLLQQRKDQGRATEQEVEEGEQVIQDGVGEVGGGGDDKRKVKGKGKDVFVPWEKQEPVIPRKKKEPTPRRGGVRGSGNKKQQAAVTTSLPEKEEGGEVGEGISKLSLKEDKSTTTTKEEEQPPSTTTTSDPTPTPTPVATPPKPTFNRYYHLFSHYELSSLVQNAAESLNLQFEYPPDYPLDDKDREFTAGEKKEEGEWEGYAKLKEERWERENWVAEIEVGWRRIRST